MSLDSTQRLEKINEAMGNLFERSRAAAREAARTGRTETVTGRDGKQYKLGSDVTRAQPGSALYDDRLRMEREAAQAGRPEPTPGLRGQPMEAPTPSTAPARIKPAPMKQVLFGDPDKIAAATGKPVAPKPTAPIAPAATPSAPRPFKASTTPNFVEITPEERKRVTGENIQRGMDAVKDIMNVVYGGESKTSNTSPASVKSPTPTDKPVVSKPTAPEMPPSGTVGYGTQDQRIDNQKGYVGYGTQDQRPTPAAKPVASGSVAYGTQDQRPPALDKRNTSVQNENYILPQSRKLFEKATTTTITSSRGKGSLEEATRSVTKDILREVNNIRNR